MSELISAHTTATEDITLATHHSDASSVAKYEFVLQTWGKIDDVIDLLLEVKKPADGKQTILFSDLRAGGLRPIGHGKKDFYIGLRKVRIRLICGGCRPVPGSGLGDDSKSQTYIMDNIKVKRLSSKLWEIATKHDEIYFEGHLIQDAPLTPLNIYESGDVEIEATLRVYPKDIELHEFPENPDSQINFGVKGKLLKIILGKIIGKDEGEIILMKYVLKRQRVSDGRD